MHKLNVLVLATALACAIARLPESTEDDPASSEPSNPYLNDVIVPVLMVPRFLGYDESPGIFQGKDSKHEWLNKEIERINDMKQRKEPQKLHKNVKAASWIPIKSLVQRKRNKQRDPDEIQMEITNEIPIRLPVHIKPNKTESRPIFKDNKIIVPPTQNIIEMPFALTPRNRGYFKLGEKFKTQQSDGSQEGGKSSLTQLEPPRQIRQNPNLSRTKTLVTDDLDRLRSRTAYKDYRLPVSLLPTNLRWLKVNHPKDDEESSPEDTENISVGETTDPAESLYDIAIVAAVGVALAMAIVGFALGWYKLSKQAKAAADVDYPAYGVTGPSIDMSGDRKLAHSAHMYHYQHQKQQIIAMGRNGMEQRNGSVSDPESEEENEEGDYTVYECPGFATTGDIEVKNPMFSEEPTPPTPAKCELVKPQPKD